MRIPLTAGVLAAASVLMFPAIAFVGASSDRAGVVVAADPPTGAPCSVGESVVVCFEALGDVLWVKDQKADGNHVDGLWTSTCGLADEVPEHSTIYIRGMPMDADDEPIGDGTSGPVVSAPTT